MSLLDKHIKQIISELPKLPGVYQYFGAEGEIIYIGKAKNLKNRVSSYLNKKNQIGKTALLVKKTKDLKYIVVETEQDALLLENNLIKQYKPKYNILLKDDKSYPWICIKKESFPRVFITRNIKKDGSEYFGPYTSVFFARSVLELIKQTYKLRTCNYNLEKKQVDKMNYKVCLQYHIKNCDAPCVMRIQEQEYNERISGVRSILKGNFSSIINSLKCKMFDYANELLFEEAENVKNSIERLQVYQSKSMVVSDSINDTDVFSYIEDDKYSYVNYLKIVKGCINQVYTLEIERKIEEDSAALLSYAILEIRNLLISKSHEIIIPFIPDVKFENIKYTIPQIGDKKKLLELSERNAKFFMLDKRKLRAGNKEKKQDLIVEEMRRDLKLHVAPVKIECFDNSNIQGTNPVAACVVFINGVPAKREYRKFHVKTVEGPDDFASMEEIVYRRYSRVLEENLQLPDLIVIDGGKGQLNAAINSLRSLNLYGKIPIIGLAKRMEEIYYPEDKDPYILSKNSTTLKILMHIRDEAHRFGITFHRKLRQKGMIKSELTEIKGVGSATETLLLKQFKTVDKIKKTTLDDLSNVVGIKKATLIHDFFNS